MLIMLVCITLEVILPGKLLKWFTYQLLITKYFN